MLFILHMFHIHIILIIRGVGDIVHFGMIHGLARMIIGGIIHIIRIIRVRGIIRRTIRRTIHHIMAQIMVQVIIHHITMEIGILQAKSQIGQVRDGMEIQDQEVVEVIEWMERHKMEAIEKMVNQPMEMLSLMEIITVIVEIVQLMDNV